MSERGSVARFRLKKALESLASKEGRGTELISLYIPPGRQISDVMNYLRQEYSTASNIKSAVTRKHVLDAITKVMQRLKLFKETPKNGLIMFCGAIPRGAPGSEEMELYVITPPEPINIYLYRCDNKFHIDPLQDMVKEKEVYGIMVIDGSGAAYATLRGQRLEIIKEITSGLPGKHRAGGQSARRFERLREVEVNEYYKRAGEYANKIFSSISGLSGIIIGGPGPTKSDFEEGEYLHYTLKKAILARVDTAYVGEQGVKEVVGKAPEILRNVRYVEEKNLVQQFLYELGHDTGLATYGENEVREALQKGVVKTLIISEGLDIVRAKIKCSNCNYAEEKTVKSVELSELKQSLIGKPCPNCSIPALTLSEMKDLVDELAELGEQTGVNVEIISTETEEGQGLLNSFGGVAAILRFRRS